MLPVSIDLQNRTTSAHEDHLQSRTTHLPNRRPFSRFQHPGIENHSHLAALRFSKLSTPCSIPAVGKTMPLAPCPLRAICAKATPRDVPEGYGVTPVALTWRVQDLHGDPFCEGFHPGATFISKIFEMFEVIEMGRLDRSLTLMCAYFSYGLRVQDRCNTQRSSHTICSPSWSRCALQRLLFQSP